MNQIFHKTYRIYFFCILMNLHQSVPICIHNMTNRIVWLGEFKSQNKNSTYYQPTLMLRYWLLHLEVRQPDYSNHDSFHTTGEQNQYKTWQPDK